MTLKGFLFDLDQTLVDSSGLAGLRHMGMWSQVAARMQTIRAFAGTPPPHEIPGRLHAAGFRIGIVTSSPRSYAESVIRTFGIHSDALVAYHDTTSHKPDPEPIQAALTALGLQAAEVCHVGDDAKDHEASYRAGVRSIGAGWSGNALAWSSACPDLQVMQVTALLDPAFVETAGYLSEVLADGREPVAHDGWSIACEANTHALGRYFTRSDPRAVRSSLTSAVLALKDADEPAERLGRAVGEFIQRSGWQPRYVVPIPRKPNETRNRFEVLLQHAQPWLQGALVYHDGLTWTKQVDNYKAKGAAARRAEMRDAFRSTYTWRDSRVLLLDDVLTTDATTTAGAAALKAASASDVMTLVLAKDQMSFAPSPECPKCGAPTKLRSSAYGKFWGCTQWRRGDPSSCDGKINADP